MQRSRDASPPSTTSGRLRTCAPRPWRLNAKELLMSMSPVEPKPAAAPSITALSVTETARLIRRKKLSPVEVVKAYLDRIETVEPRLNAFATLASEQAIAQACRAEYAMMDEQPLPLLGVPITVKSSIEVQGLRCEAGS